MVSGGLSVPSTSAGPPLQFVGRAHVKGKKRWIKNLLITIDLLGLQLVWSTEMAYASPYLLSLGLSKSGMSAVFLAGPLSGLIVQPIIGTVADRSKSRFGRRRPVIVIGCAICVLSLLIFGYTREVASVFTTWGSSAHSTLTIWLAVFAVYALDFAINGVMAADRALIVDVLPISQQEEANAWAARVAGAGSILGFWIGNVDLTYGFSFLGDSQIKILSVFACLALTICHGITIFSVEERVLLDEDAVISVSAHPSTLNFESGRFGLRDDEGITSVNAAAELFIKKSRKSSREFMNSLKEIWTTYQNLPLPIWHICKVQAFAWGGWFPILFFSTTYVAEIYSSSHPALDTPSSSPSSTLPHEADPGTRAGSRAMFLQSVFTFIMSIILPFFVNSSAYISRSSTSFSKHDSSLPNPVASHSNHSRSKVRLSNDHGPNTSERSSSASLGIYNTPRTDYPFLDKILERLPTIPFPWLDLDLLWAISHVAFAVLMFSTWFVGSVWSATLILSLLSFSWAVTCWAPTALLAQEILQDRSPPPIKVSRSSHQTVRDFHTTDNALNEPESFALLERSASSDKRPPNQHRAASNLSLTVNGSPFRIEDEEHSPTDQILLAPQTRERGDSASLLSSSSSANFENARSTISTSRATSRSASPPGSGASTPKRYRPATDAGGSAIHPEPLEVHKKLQALNRSPRRNNISRTAPGQSNADERSGQYPVPGKTLQIRHSSSFDSTSYASSDDDDPDDSFNSNHNNSLSSPYLSTLPRSYDMDRDFESTDTIHASSSQHALPARSSRRYDQAQQLNDLENEMGMPNGPAQGEQTRTADQAGAILGIANIFVVLPQFLTSFLSSIIFAFFAPATPSEPSPELQGEDTFTELVRRSIYARAGIHVPAASNDAIGFVFRVGGVLALVAAWLCWTMRKRKRAAMANAGYSGLR